MVLYKNKKNITKEEQNTWIDNVFENASKEDIVWMCSIKAGIHKNQVFNEKLSWNVIDKAGLADEAEIKRRREFKRKQQRKHIIHVCTGCAILTAIIIVLAAIGIFDREEMQYYKYNVYWVSNARINTNDMEWYKKVQDYTFPDLKEIPAGSFPAVDENVLDNTMYLIAAEYCASNGFVIDDYRIKEIHKEQTTLGEYVLLCTMKLGCYDKNMTPDNIKNMYYPDFHVVVYTGHIKTSSNVQGIYTCSIESSIKEYEKLGLRRNLVVKAEPSIKGYYISIEDTLKTDIGICGNALPEIYSNWEVPLNTSFNINKSLKKNKTYTFGNDITGNGITFKMKFMDRKLMFKYCYKGDNMHDKNYLEMPKS